jgi:hypothetical protein
MRRVYFKTNAVELSCPMNRHMAFLGNADRQEVEIIGLMAYRQL